VKPSKKEAPVPLSATFSVGHPPEHRLSCHPESILPTGPDEVSAAAAAYCSAFGHRVPAEVLQLFALRPGPLVMEIRQAIALGRPVPGWRALSSESSASSMPPFTSSA